MAITGYENNLKLMLAQATEHDSKDYVILIAIGPRSPSSERQCDFALNRTNSALALSIEASFYFAQGFLDRYGVLPVCVIACHVLDVPKANVIDYLSAKFNEAVDIPTPSTFDEVERWNLVIERKEGDALAQ